MTIFARCKMHSRYLLASRDVGYVGGEGFMMDQDSGEHADGRRIDADGGFPVPQEG